MSNTKTKLSVEDRKNSLLRLNKENTANFKGYYFEIEVVKPIIEAIPNIKYECNPTNYNDWKQNHNRNSYDGVVTLPDGKKIHLEMKLRMGNRVYHSWFLENWLPREGDIIVTNNPSVISYQDKRSLDKKGVKLMSLSETEVYLGKIVRNILHPGKYLYLNSPLQSIFFNIKRLLTGIFMDLSMLRVKTRIKNWISSIILIIMSGLPAQMLAYITVSCNNTYLQKQNQKGIRRHMISNLFFQFMQPLQLGIILVNCHK